MRAAVIAGLVVAGCTATPDLPPAPIVVRIAPPVELLHCADQPEPGAIRSQRDVARYVLRLAEAGDDCRAKLTAVRRFIDQPGDGGADAQ